jgi:zinc transport system ATP-binding protein
MALITCHSLTLAYDGFIAVQNISFSLEKGAYLAVVGENGSGKSTLIKGLLGLIPPVSGTVSLAEGLTKREIGYLPQQTVTQKDFPASVREVVISGCLGRRGLKPFYARADKEEAERQMERLGIAQLSRQCYRELSGGQQQRVLLARALCATSRLLIMDEPVNGLDPIVTAELYNHITDINRELSVSVLKVSHDNSAIAYASHVLHLQKDLLFYGPRAAYLTSPASAGYRAKGGMADV